MNLNSFMATLQREWWWSPVPPWQYIKHGTGWGTLQDPGVFNLVWASSGAQMPPQSYGSYVSNVLWVLTDAQLVPIAGDTLSGLACTLSLAEFESMLQHHKQELDRWDFSDGHTTSSIIIQSIRNARRRART
jgi:hypothetical protein